MVAVTSGQYVPKWKIRIATSPPGLIEISGLFLPFKTKVIIRMAKSNLAVVESGVEQAVVETEAGLTNNQGVYLWL
jgi:hypothetical protein